MPEHKTSPTQTQPPPEEPGDSPTGWFPTGPEWELTPERVWSWFQHGFSRLRGDCAFVRALGRLDANELALLIWDLECYHGLCLRYLRGQGPRPRPLAEYLEGWQTDPRTGEVEECRQHWGIIAREVRAHWGEPGDHA